MELTGLIVVQALALLAQTEPTNNNTILMVVFGLVAVGGLIYALVPRQSEADDEMLRRIQGKRREDDAVKQGVERSNAIKKALEGRVGQRMAGMMGNNQKETNRIKAELIAAGYRSKEAFTVFMAVKFIVGIVCMLAGLTLFLLSEMSLTNRLMILGAGFALGFVGPSMWLGTRMSARKRLIRNGLPDALDLMVVSVEAGLGLDAALQKVSDELKSAHPALCEEFSIAIMETTLGVPRSEALQNMAVRTGVEEVRQVVSMIVQCERFGTSIGKSLRTLSDVMRVKRRQRAEEKAAQCAVKLLMPLIFFIFPALFVVLAGPGGIKIYNTFMGPQAATKGN